MWALISGACRVRVGQMPSSSARKWCFTDSEKLRHQRESAFAASGVSLGAEGWHLFDQVGEHAAELVVIEGPTADIVVQRPSLGHDASTALHQG